MSVESARQNRVSAFSRGIGRHCKIVRLLGLTLAGLSAKGALAAPVLLSAAWTDQAIIQRDAPITISGTARPQERITAQLGEQRATATADAHGAFSLHFPPRSASDAPLTLRVTGADGSATLVQDLLVGDVWLCSGQSNMEFPVERGLNGSMVAQRADDPGLRLLQIPKMTASVPAERFGAPVRWSTATPASVPGFSAACYFMGAALRAAQRVPIGLIHASWGGSRLRPWLTPDAAVALEGADDLAMLRQHDSDPLGAVTAFAPQWERWYREEADGSEPWLRPDSIAWSDVPHIGVWNDWAGTPLARDTNGTVWLRRTVRLTSAQAQAGATLELGIMDDMDMTFVNGRAVGNTFSWDQSRRYALPPALLRAGDNEIMVAISNSWDKGGFTTGAEQLRLTINGGAAVPLAQGWRYSIAPVPSFPPRPPWDGNGGLGVMHNAMVAPLGQIALKGAAWYQGESDVDLPGYADRLRALTAGWRRQFGTDLRMLVVQLANFGAPQLAPTASGWASLREEQRAFVAGDSNAALVTAIDLGERTDIHPANKTLLGERLAMAAQGIALPMPVSAGRAQGQIRVAFSGVEGRLAAWSAAAPIGFELCGNTQESCRYAQAAISGADVWLRDDGQAATRVRYGWADSPIVNLFDARALPVPGFELPIAGD
ncbi:MAG: sialate O-acetylesterase [Alphaproteobacteria bacterium]|nr:sialate O-acetylesterase [Alphaproteobacteria bacterium]MBU0794379.1 sialate O-acetylesterase [Alphaproteobacteria bacterium]MBU0874444.1 sialate O-acetylesterase [Alphaproteobacteria bacterium]MBU1768511.1 sialate O-acetylesterase [Alphaproteobacteria bacterium]